MFKRMMITVAAACFIMLSATGSALAVGTAVGTDITNHATATYKDVTNTAMPGESSNTVHTSVILKASLTLAISPAPAATNDGLPGGDVVFTLTLRNTGNGSDDFNFTAAAHQSGAFSATGLKYYSDSGCTSEITGKSALAADTDFVFYMKSSIPLAATNGQTSTDRVTATSTSDGTATAYVDGITKCIEASLTMTKTVDNASPNPGDTVQYTVTVHNGGLGTAKSVVVTDDLTNMNVIATFKTGSLVVDGVTQSDPSSTTPMVVNFPDIAAGGSKTMTFQMTIKGGIVDGTSKANTASVTYGPDGPKPGGTPPSPPTVTVQAPAISVHKQVKVNSGAYADGPVNAKPGDTLTYKITATNNGHSNATTVVIIDNVDSMWSYVHYTAGVTAATDGAGTITPNPIANAWNAGTHTMTVNIDTLEVGKVLTVTFPVTIQ